MFTSSGSRRDLLKMASLGALTIPTSGWFSQLAYAAKEQSRAKTKAQHKSCILFFMTGGASQVDTFDPKPKNDTCAFKAIKTSVPGIEVAETLPKMARVMQHCALLRSMSTKEGSHGRARYYMHTGFRQGAGGLTYPSIGAIASATLGNPEDTLPNFVCVGGQTFGSGYLGPAHMPLEIRDPTKGVENLKPVDSMPAFDRRRSLLEEIEQGFLNREQLEAGEAHRKTYQRAAGLMHSAKARAFDIDKEPAHIRELYGRSQMGNACLLARRLVEEGVTFIEIPMGGWDTHRDNTGRIKKLCGDLDQPMAALIADLKQRGMLDSTLIIWMGDFGRTPTLGKQGGRDHFPRAWTTMLAGGGIKSGQVIGKTNDMGGDVVDRPISAVDFMATVCKVMDIDYKKEFHTREGRPIRPVDKGEKLITELLRT
ncbi:MAG: DUF1501 domain-containing protein [Gemmatales bacterium]